MVKLNATIRFRSQVFLMCLLGLQGCDAIGDVFSGSRWCSEGTHTVVREESTPPAVPCWRSGTECTLKNAIRSVNNCNDPQTLELVEDGIYTFVHADNRWEQRGDPERRVVNRIRKDLTIEGNGATLQIASGVSDLWYFEVEPDASLEIRDLTIAGSRRIACDRRGGASAVFNRGTTVLDRVELINHDTCTAAGAVYSESILTIRSSVFRNNRSSRTDYGVAAVAAVLPEVTEPESTLTISDSLFEGNRSDGDQRGAAILACFGARCEMSGSSVIGNDSGRTTVYLGTGGGDGPGRLNIRTSTIANNTGAHSGAFEQFDGQIRVFDSTIADNVGLVASVFANDCCGSISLSNSAVSIPGPTPACVVPSITIEPSSHGMANDGSCAGVRTVPDLRLGPITRTAAGLAIRIPEATSPLIDAGRDCTTPDQRGFIRPSGPACDVGAIEVR